MLRRGLSGAGGYHPRDPMDTSEDPRAEGPPGRAEGSVRRSAEEEFERLRAEVSALRRTEAELTKAKTAAEAASRAKSEFLANMSHELRTPLAAILGYAEMLREEAEEGVDQSRLTDLGRIHAAGTNLLALIDAVLEMARLEAGKTLLLVEPFDLRALVGEAVSAVTPAAERNGNRVEVVEAGPAGTVRGDARKVRDVLSRLLDNAVKFTSNGTVTVTLGPAPGGTVRISVADTGIGIDPGQMATLFSPFVQGDESPARRFGGTGLGLALTQRICRLMGGDLTAESEPGKGSTFTVTLPVEYRGPAVNVEPGSEGALPARPAVGPSVPPPSSHPRPFRGRLLLVIDDDPNVRDLMVRNLGRAGYPVVTAWGGEEGLRLARVLRPSAIILDVLMPQMNGWDVLSAVKADPDLAGVPVVLTTVLDEAARSFARGASAFVRKPVDFDQLAGLLEGLVRE